MLLIIPEPYRADMGRKLHGSEFIQAGICAVEAEKRHTPTCKREGCNNGYRPGKTSD